MCLLDWIVLLVRLVVDFAFALVLVVMCFACFVFGVICWFDVFILCLVWFGWFGLLF